MQKWISMVEFFGAVVASFLTFFVFLRTFGGTIFVKRGEVFDNEDGTLKFITVKECKEEQSEMVTEIKELKNTVGGLSTMLHAHMKSNAEVIGGFNQYMKQNERKD